MPVSDITRSALQPAKHFTGVRLQQGRVLTDDDFNEHAGLAAEDARVTRLHTIGPAGAPDEGFRVGAVDTAAGQLDFPLAAGTYYVGGHRVVCEGFAYAEQPDWLDQPASARVLPKDARVDLVYLEVWEQAVSATEDGELLEVALGGPDTTTRARLFARVRVLADVGEGSCGDAWTKLGEALAEAGLGTLGPDGELVPDLTLSVSFEEGSDPADLCHPQVAAGYLGAENQAIRVELVGGALAWGYDNASPLYRVNVDADGETVHFVTQPRDAMLWPLADQIVEILPLGALLPNGEAPAAARGHFARVATSYDPSDPDDPVLTLDPPLPAGFGEAWKTRSDAAVIEALPHRFYLRSWARGGDTGAEPLLAAAPGTPVSLETTGLVVTLDGTSRNADAGWTIAVRPSAPDTVVPWELGAGRAPDGVRRFVAPLGLLRWSADGASATVHDCRPPFLPLTRTRGCCRYTVGDGRESWGQYQRIQDAIDALPPDGGEVCLLPGTFTENVRISGRDVTLHGCGARSRIVGEDAERPALEVAGGRGVRVHDLAVEHLVGVPVHVTGPRTEDVRLERLVVEGRDQGGVAARGVTAFVLAESEVTLAEVDRSAKTGFFRGLLPAVVVQGDDLLVERCAIRAEGTAEGAGAVLRLAWGGVQVGGDSADVVLRGNRIEGGLGHGVMLGSLHVEGVEEEDDDGLFVIVPGFAGVRWDDCCPVIDWTPLPPTDDGGSDARVVSDGPITRLRVEDNAIRGMAQSGIGPVAFFPLDDAESAGIVQVDGLVVRQNRIEGNAFLEGGRVDPTARRFDVAVGGIVLPAVSDAIVRENVVADNGAARNGPVCGIYVLFAQGVEVTENHVFDNGRFSATPTREQNGAAGGLVVWTAAPPPEAGPSGGYAVRVAGNTIAHPTVPGIAVTAIGAAVVEGNRVHVQANSTLDDPARALALRAFGAAATVVGLGVPPELADAAGGKVALATAPVRFSSNQVVLDARSDTQALLLGSVVVFTLDDATVQDNQLAVRADDDLVVADLVAMGTTCRVLGNRFSESLGHALVSAATVGTANVTVNNQSTHCLLVLGAQTVDTPNLVIGVSADVCGRLGAAGAPVVKGFEEEASVATGGGFAAGNAGWTMRAEGR